MRKTIFLKNKYGLLLFSVFLLAVVLSGSSYAYVGANLQVVLIKTEPVTLQSGEYADVWVKLINAGTVVARDVNLKYEPNFPFSVNPKEKISWFLGDIMPGEEYYVHFEILVDKTAVEGGDNLEFLVSQGTYTSTQKVPVQIGIGSPALTIEKVVSDPEFIVPGSEANLTLYLKNAGSSYLRDIDINLTFETSVPLLPVESTSVKRVKEVLPGEVKSVSFKIKAIEGATSGTYRVPVTLKYYDMAGNSYQKSELTGLTVGGTPELKVNIENTIILKSGETNTFTLSVINKGPIEAKFVNIKLLPSENYRIISPSSIYLGNIDSDDYQTTEVKIFLENEKELRLKFNLTYYSPNGKEFLKDGELPLKVYTGREISKYGLKKENKSWVIILIVLLIILGYLGYRKFRKRKNL